MGSFISQIQPVVLLISSQEDEELKLVLINMGIIISFQLVECG